MAYFVLMVW